MPKKSIVLILFAIVALVQLYIPAKMIWDKEDVLENGIAYKFKTEAVDPTDLFRGKYIYLNYEESTILMDSIPEWVSRDRSCYAYLKTDSLGFAKIDFISQEIIKSSQDYFKIKIGWVSNNDEGRINLNLDINRYYMEESKAYDAEVAYQDSQADTTVTTYALVKIKDGTAVIEDVIIGDQPILEVVKQIQKEN